MQHDGFVESKCVDRKSAGGGTNLAKRSRSTLSPAARRAWRAGRRTTTASEALVLQRPGKRNRDIHCRSQHQLYERLECLLQILHVLSYDTRRNALRAHFRADPSKTVETFRICR